MYFEPEPPIRFWYSTNLRVSSFHIGSLLIQEATKWKYVAHIHISVHREGLSTAKGVKQTSPSSESHAKTFKLYTLQAQFPNVKLSSGST